MSGHRRNIRSALLGASALVGAAALLGAGAARAEERQFQFDLPAQSLGESLKVYGSTADQQIIFAEGLVRGRTAPPLQGAYTAEEGLSMLLAGTGLIAERTPNGVIAIRSLTQDPQGGSAGAGAGGDVDALIVTAQKREENIQDVPIAISAFSQEDLTRSQVAGGPDLITQVPNMTFTKTNFSSYSVQIRGIGTQAISATTDPAVAVAFNNTPFIRNRFFEQEFYDLQRVEVLRGPQGTLYGRNATAGVVNIISAKPTFRYEAKASGDVSNFNSSRIEGMINVPLVEDAVALRIAGAWTKRDGYATNELTGNPIDGRDLWSTRVSLRLAPADGIDVNLIWEHFEENDDRLRSGKQLCKKHAITRLGNLDVDYFADVPDRGQAGDVISNVQSVFSQGCERNSLYAADSFQTPNGMSIPYYYQLGAIGLPRALQDPYVSEVQTPDLRVIESTIDPEYRAKAELGELQVSFDIGGGLTLQSETAYNTDTVYSLQDFNRFNTAPGAWQTEDFFGNPSTAVLRGILNEDGEFCDPQLGCSDRLVAVDISTATSWQFSQEFRLSSDFDGPFNFSLGGNYLRADSEDKYYVFINSISLISVINADGADPYVMGESDNRPCLTNGYGPGNPNGVYSVTGCVYMDPNPIGSVNDKGHNYFLSKNPYKLISYAVFGEAYYNVTDTLKITGGLRWTIDKKDAPRVPTWILGSQSVGYPVAEVVEQEWREPTGRLTVDWKPDLSFTDETMVYGSYAHGYKAGGANPPGFVRVFYSNPDVAKANSANSATRPKTFNAEFVDAFEFGTKNTLAGGRVTVNLAAFYYDYTDYQISEIVDRSAFNRNFDAEVWGVELESDWRPLDNLKLGVKVGYEKTRIRDGEQAVDLMDRTAGMPGWSVVRPFPTLASNCILPTALYMPTGGSDPGGGSLGNLPILGLGSPNGGGPGGCEYAYLMGFDPGTEAPYGEPGFGAADFWRPGTYPGFDPSTAPNNGEGFFKQLGGNELPNAPNWTATITGDYTIPLPNEWLATLHTDLHWQSESWWRVFNDHEYDKLDEYFTMNLAAIFVNEEAGWNIMAYIKNVTDVTAITGAFLNSDDTGLTTNVFLTEPRLYGLRVTKMWTGGSLLGGFGERREGPYPFTLELGAQVQQHDAPNDDFDPSFSDEFAGRLNIVDDAQADELEWGDGRDAKLTWRPDGSAWTLSAAVRYGKTNSHAEGVADEQSEPGCAFGGPFASFCAMTDDPKYGPYTRMTATNWVDAPVADREEYQFVDLAVGRDVGLGGLSRSTFSAGLRHAQFTSSTRGEFHGVPDWTIPDGFLAPFPGLPVTHTEYAAAWDARREFDGFGPTLSWEASYPILDRGEVGRVDLDWSVTGGVLFGDQDSSFSSEEDANAFATPGIVFIGIGAGTPVATPLPSPAPVDVSRSKSTSVPTFGASLGLSYKIDRMNVGAGYRWERYFDVLDAGGSQSKQYDRTIDGPYFKVSVGFGG